MRWDEMRDEMIHDQILRLSTKPSWNWHLYQSFLNGVSRITSFSRYWWTQVRLQNSHSQTWSGTQEDSDEQECHRGDGDEPGRHAGEHEYCFQHLRTYIVLCLYFFVFYISTLYTILAFVMNQDRMPVIVIIIFNIGHFGHRHVLLVLACVLYDYIY